MKKLQKILEELHEHCKGKNIQVVVIAEDGNQRLKMGIGNPTTLLGLTELMKMELLNKLGSEEKEAPEEK
jgi:hypothetical protein